MWSIALLINTSIWSDMLTNWRLVCLVFLNYLADDDEQVHHHRAHLLRRIEKILNDPNSNAAIANTRPSKSTTVDPYEFTDDEEQDEEQPQSQTARASSLKNRRTNKNSNVIIRHSPRTGLI